MLLVLGAFATVAEAERATRALLEAGYGSTEIGAYGRAGGGRLLLGGHVPVRRAGEGARVLSRADAIGAAVLAGGTVAALAAGVALVILAWGGTDPLAEFHPWLQNWTGGALLVFAAAAFGAALASLARRNAGLPRGVAFSYGRRLQYGDTILTVQARTSDTARAIEELLAMYGASAVHATRGRLVLRDNDEDAPLPPSQN